MNRTISSQIFAQEVRFPRSKIISFPPGRQGGGIFSVGGGGGDYDVDGDKDAEDVSEARKLSVVSRN